MADDAQILVQHQHDWRGVTALCGGRFDEGACLAFAQRRGQRRGETGEEIGVGGLVRAVIAP